MPKEDLPQRRNKTVSRPISLGETSQNINPASEARPSTIISVADAAGVSTATVSRVLNGAGNVSDEVRTRVIAVISELHYSPRLFAVEMGRATRGIKRNRNPHKPARVSSRELQRRAKVASPPTSAEQPSTSGLARKILRTK